MIELSIFLLQDPFDIADMFREEIDDVHTLLQVLRNVNIDHLLSELTEYIVLELPSRDQTALDFS